MNALIVGSNKLPILDHLSDTFLLIDDGPLIDAVDVPARRTVTVFDIAKHSFNPLKDMDYRKAREFINVLDAVFPEGEGTLTRKNSNYILLSALLAGPNRLSTLLKPKPKDPAHTDAYQKIQTLLLSPVLNNVLNRPTNFTFKGTILAKLDRAKLGDFDCFVLANLLISQYKAQVVVPDFGFYACRFHTSLLRQDRLTGGIYSFDEVPKLRQHLLQVDTKIASHCTAEDAHTLGIYRGLEPGTTGFSTFVQNAIA